MKDFTKLTQATGRIITVEGQGYLFFGGTSYLGLATNTDYTALFVEGVHRYGINNGTSRSNNIQQGIFVEAEEIAASRFGFEAGLLVSSGYLAAQLAIKKLIGTGEFLYAPNCHPALWLDGNPAITDSFSTWAERTVRYINASADGSFVIISNSIDNLTPERYDFSVFSNVSPTKRVVFLLDDSHGIGITEPNRVAVNRSVFERSNFELLVVASLAKGLATDAGIVLGNADRIQTLKTSPFFTGASPSSPAALYAFIAGESIYLEQFERMQSNVALFKELTGNTLASIRCFPVFSSKEPQLFSRLAEKGFLISSFPYPLPTDPLLNRIVISGHHLEKDVLQLAGEINLLSN